MAEGPKCASLSRVSQDALLWHEEGLWCRNISEDLLFVALSGRSFGEIKVRSEELVCWSVLLHIRSFAPSCSKRKPRNFQESLVSMFIEKQPLREIITALLHSPELFRVNAPVGHEWLLIRAMVVESWGD
jgi:hypothetical protein